MTASAAVAAGPPRPAARRPARRSSLRRRLAVTTGAAVAGSVFLVSLACWLLVRNELRSRVDASLVATYVAATDDFTVICTAPAEPSELTRLSQYIYPSGKQTCGPGSTLVTVRKTDLTALTGVNGQPHDEKTASGESVRVMAKPAGNGAVLVTRSLTETNRALARLGLVLLGLSVAGGVVATLAGRLVARGVMKPVEELTVTAEHVARTQDLGVRIGVQGTDEMARLAEAFTAMTAALSESREDQRRLVQDAGHELRTPLTSLKTNVELLIRAEANPGRLPAADRATLLKDLSAQTDELATLIEELTVLARQADGPGQKETVALDEVVRRAVERVERRGGHITWQMVLAPWQVMGSASLLERAVVNLLDNAVKFTPTQGLVSVELRNGELTVTDSGPGIAEGELSHVFDRFWRSADARGLPGSGLGLSIVAMTAQQHGGEVTLTNVRGPQGVTGAVARLRIPGTPPPLD